MRAASPLSLSASPVSFRTWWPTAACHHGREERPRGMWWGVRGRPALRSAACATPKGKESALPRGKWRENCVGGSGAAPAQTPPSHSLSFLSAPRSPLPYREAPTRGPTPAHHALPPGPHPAPPRARGRRPSVSGWSGGKRGGAAPIAPPPAPSLQNNCLQNLLPSRAAPPSRPPPSHPINHQRLHHPCHPGRRPPRPARPAGNIPRGRAAGGGPGGGGLPAGPLP